MVERKFNIKEVEVKELNPEDSTVVIELEKCTLTVKEYIEETVAHIREVNKQVKGIKMLKMLNSVFTKIYLVFLAYVIIEGSHILLKFLTSVVVYAVVVFGISLADKAKVKHLNRKTGDTNAALNKLDLVPVILTDYLEVLEVSRQRVIIKGVRKFKDPKMLPLEDRS